MSRLVLSGGAVVTMDGRLEHSGGHEHTEGHVVVDDGRIVSVGAGSAPSEPDTRHIDTTGCLVTPGLVNAHDHLYQWVSRGYAADAKLFDWLTTLYPLWERLDADAVRTAATAGVASLALSGCTTTADHHYVFPRDGGVLPRDGGDVFAAMVEGASRVGPRLHAVRGSMDRGRSRGGLPPDSVVEDRDDALAATEDAIRRFHDSAPEALVKVAVGPCSPFTVSPELMRGAAELAREHGVRLHTHLAETADEDQRCREEFGIDPVQYADSLGWLGPDVWLAHTVNVDPDGIRRIGAAGTATAHCPSSNGRLGAGMAPVRSLLNADVAVGLGVDGAASNEAGSLVAELRQALLTARAQGGPDALKVREALWMATRGGACCLGREGELGSLTPGKLADIAVWRLDDLGHAGIEDSVAALVLGAPPRLAHLLRGGQTVVADGQLTQVSEADLTKELRAVSARFRDIPEVAR